MGLDRYVQRRYRLIAHDKTWPHRQGSGDTDPLSLYAWLTQYEERTGGRAMAFAHNGNLSNGWMFPTEKT